MKEELSKDIFVPTLRPIRVIIESPYAGNVEKNRLYALACLRDSLSRGEAPFASHLLYPQVLTKWTEKERLMGIAAGFAWYSVAELCAVYLDNGVTEGMIRGIAKAESLDIPVWRRSLEE